MGWHAGRTGFMGWLPWAGVLRAARTASASRPRPLGGTLQRTLPATGRQSSSSRQPRVAAVPCIFLATTDSRLSVQNSIPAGSCVCCSLVDPASEQVKYRYQPNPTWSVGQTPSRRPHYSGGKRPVPPAYCERGTATAATQANSSLTHSLTTRKAATYRHGQTTAINAHLVESSQRNPRPVAEPARTASALQSATLRRGPRGWDCRLQARGACRHSWQVLSRPHVHAMMDGEP